MQITVSGRHTEVSPALRTATESKISRLQRILTQLDRAEVHYSEERNPRIAERELCEVALDGHGHHVRCKATGPDGFAALDAVVAKLEIQLQRLKTRQLPRKHLSPRV